ncbi:MAG: hypothetical protein NXI30_18920 [bacterium]|nr:hypothetical protein [bacterium]
MTTVQTARGIVADAEKALRDLIQQQIDEHRYTELPELARLADGVARLLRGDAPAVQSEPRVAVERAPGAAQPAKRTATKRHSAKAAKKADYPKFTRDGDRLIKIGWSKKAREEYEHRTPRDAARAFWRHLATSTTSGKLFTIEELLPVPDASGGDVPGYQVYMTLAWLRKAGLIEKRGREGYLVTAPDLSDQKFDALWDEIPARVEGKQ